MVLQFSDYGWMYLNVTNRSNLDVFLSSFPWRQLISSVDIVLLIMIQFLIDSDNRYSYWCLSDNVKYDHLL